MSNEPIAQGPRALAAQSRVTLRLHTEQGITSLLEMRRQLSLRIRTAKPHHHAIIASARAMVKEINRNLKVLRSQLTQCD